MFFSNNEMKKEWNNKTKLKTYSFNTFLFVISGIMAYLYLQFFHFQFDWMMLTTFINDYSQLTIISIFIILIFQLPVFIISGNIWIGFILSNLISFAIAFSNYQKMLYRPEPLYPSDVLMLKDIKFLFFSIEMKQRIIFGIVFIVLLSLLSFVIWNVRKKANVTKKSLLTRVVALILSLGLLYPIFNFNSNGNIIKTTFEKYGKAGWIPFNQTKNYDRNGVVAGLLYNLSSQVIEKPEGYSKEKVQQIMDKYNKIAKKENKARTGDLKDTNIVFIMNESFADPQNFEGMSVTPDPLPNFREIISKNSSGEMLSQGFGGGTANIEFEALSGISMEPMLPNISVAYTQLTAKMEHVPTLITYFDNVEKAQRKMTAIHPFQPTMYRRPEVYKDMGFDEMIFEENMDFDEKLESSLYISDKSSYEQVYKVLSESDEKDFIHLVTMQGHGPYHVGYFGNLQGFQIEGPVDKMDMLNYISSLSYSDDALKSYIKEINSLDEKTITVFWGDHLPSAFGEEITSINEPIKKYLTPVFIHSNFETPNKNLGIISPMYYMNEILNMSNAKLSGYYAMLGEMRKQIPAFEKLFHIYSEEVNLGITRYPESKGSKEMLTDYDILVYDIFEGEHYFEKYGFFE